MNSESVKTLPVPAYLTPTYAFLRSAIRRLAGFAGDRRGNMAMMTALVAVPAIGMIGFGVDYGRALSVQVGLQSASDAAALMLAQTASNMTASQMQTAAQNYIAASYYNPMTSNLSVRPRPTLATALH